MNQSVFTLQIPIAIPVRDSRGAVVSLLSIGIPLSRKNDVQRTHRDIRVGRRPENEHMANSSDDCGRRQTIRCTVVCQD